jgi:Flp pilus assembly protein TadB
MKTYQLKSEAFQVFRRRWLSRYVPFAALVCGLLGYFYAYPRMETEGSVWYLLFPMALAVGGMYWILRRNLQRHRKAWDEFELYIDGETIGLGERLNPQVAIKREEIETIGESPEGDLYVQAKEDKGQLIVPKDLDGWEEVKALLAGWGEIQPISSDSIQRTNFLRYGLAIAFVIITGMTYFGKSLWVVLPAAVLFAAGLAWWVWVAWKSRNTPQRSNFRMSWLLLFVVIMLAVAGMRVWEALGN